MTAKIEKDNDDFKKEVLKIYTPLSVAKEEIWKRWNDKKLRKKVEKFLGGDVPECFKKSPKAVIARNIASPNKEFVRFLDLAKLASLEPQCLEFTTDKFCAANQDKYYLGKLFFFNGVGKKWGEKTKAIRVIDYDKAENKQFRKISTIWGENLVDFHHRLLECIYKDCEKIISDESNWIKRNGKTPEKFYEKFLALFICYGILFENYLSSESSIINKVIEPNYKRVEQLFGMKPLLVKLFPIGCDYELFWQYYPQILEKSVKL